MKTIHDYDHIAQVLVANPSLGHRAIAKLTGVSRTAVWYVARKRGIRQETVSFPQEISATTEAKVLTMLDRGATLGVIAAATGLSQRTVHKIARRQNLPTWKFNSAGTDVLLRDQEPICALVHTIISDFREQMREEMFKAQDRAHKKLKSLIRKRGLSAVQAALHDCSEGATARVDAVLELERELQFVVTGAL